MKISIRKYLLFILGISVIGFFCLVFAPWLNEQYLPSKFRQEINNRNIDPTHLFYTESIETHRACLLLTQS